MTQEKFDYLCKILGDPELPEDERWKSIAYIHIYSSFEPAGSFQYMLKSDQIYYLNDPVLGGGFFYISAPDGAYDTINGEKYNISWMPLEYITEITFKGWYNYPSVADQVFGISDIINTIGGEAKPLPTNVVIENVIIKQSEAENYEPLIKSNRNIAKSDVEITYYDKLNNEIDKPTTPGEYKIKVECVGDYIGSDSAKYIIQHDPKSQAVIDKSAINYKNM